MSLPSNGSASKSSISKKKRSSLRRFLDYVLPYYRLMLGSIICGLGKFILPATTAIALRFVTDRLVIPQTALSKPDFSFRWTEQYLNWLANTLPFMGEVTPWKLFTLLMITLVIIYALWGVSSFYRGYLSQVAAHRTMLDLRSDLYQHITRMGHSFFQKHQSGGIVSRLMADIALTQNFIGSAMTTIWMDLGACGFFLILLFSMDTHLAIATLVVFPFYILCMKRYGGVSKQNSKMVQEAMEEFSGDLQERIAGIAVVKSFAAEQREALHFFSAARELFDLTVRSMRTTNMSNAIINWLSQMGTLGLIWYGGYRVLSGETTIGVMTAFVLLLPQLYGPINRMSEMNTILHNSLAAIDRVFEIFDIEPDLKEKPGAIRLPKIKGTLHFENLSFAYVPGRKQLHEINLKIQPGEMVALVGPSGAGKSTLIQLIPRFYDPQKGRVMVDGFDLREVRLRSLRSQIGMVAQETLLFSGTVEENLLYGRPNATEGEISAAAEAAHAHEFIKALDNGYHTLLGERGAKLSGGQRQRLALARAFLCDPRILILDEATSALDSESEALIQEALGRLMKNRTSIVIAHRLSTIVNANRIVVMTDGRIREVGPHQELLAQNGIYARLYETQFGTADD